jgi:hypothetical protein
MDRDKIAQLAKSLSTSCKQVVKNDKLTQKLTSPAVVLIALTVMEVVADHGFIDKGGGWGS